MNYSGQASSRIVVPTVLTRWFFSKRIGSIGDFFASFIYVPSEVLKTRMQLQGRYNNPSFISGYNYKNTWHALQMIVKYDGVGALYQGYRATLLRDVPFSALQFAFYGKKKNAKEKLNPFGDKVIKRNLWANFLDISFCLNQKNSRSRRGNGRLGQMDKCHYISRQPAELWLVDWLDS